MVGSGWINPIFLNLWTKPDFWLYKNLTEPKPIFFNPTEPYCLGWDF